MTRKNPPDGLDTERVLRGLIRTIARKLKNPNLTVKESLALLKEQQKLSEQLRESAAARLELDIAEGKKEK